MAKNDWDNLGRDIRDLVQDAVDSQNFSKLNQDIRDSIRSTIEVVNRSMKDAASLRGRSRSSGPEAPFEKKTYSAAPAPAAPVPPGLYRNTFGDKAGGIALAVTGGLFTLGTGIALHSILMVGLFEGYALGHWIACGILFPIFLISLILCLSGSGRLKRIRRFRQYIRLLGEKTAYPVKDLAGHTNRTVKYVLRDLKKMISSGWFREGCLDRDETCLITSRETFEHYQALLREPAQEEASASPEETPEEENALPEEAQKILRDGRAYLEQIRQSNERIPGEEISAKISRIELIVKRIFDRVEQMPETVSDIQKLMDYYLPTTIKLLNAYEELDSQPVQGENILSSKKEIEDTLDTLNQAFERLLDNLFKDIAWDVSTDISVLQTMLAQEGLTGGSDFKTTH